MNKAKSRQHERGKANYETYRNRGTRLTNKARKLRKHLARFAGDTSAIAAAKSLGMKL